MPGSSRVPRIGGAAQLGSQARGVRVNEPAPRGAGASGSDLIGHQAAYSRARDKSRQRGIY
ncbi:MAG: hypothetical protein ACODAG_08135 [Myxococcota bacterium]